MERISVKRFVLFVGFLVFLIMPKVELHAGESDNWVWPTDNHYIQNDFPRYAGGGDHSGTDFPVPLNSNVYSTCEGDVVSIKYMTTSYGRHIKIKAKVNGEFVYIRYCHLNEILVREGQHVKAGDLIGRAGNTGNSRGYHLHYEVRNSADSYPNTLNPRLFLPGTSYKYESSENPIPQIINNPTGNIDAIVGVAGGVFVRGWTFDEDDKSNSLEVHVYIGGPAERAGTVGVEAVAICANVENVNVNNAYGCGVYHGIDSVINTNLCGQQEVYIYAINIGSGQNVLIGKGSVNIPRVVDLGNEFTAKIRNPKSNMLVSPEESNNISLQSDSNTLNQEWKFYRQTDGSYKIENAQHKGMCLDDYLASGSGGNVVLHPDNGTVAQRWYIQETNGVYVLSPACSRTSAIDIANAKTEEKTNIQIYDLHKGENQQFNIEKIYHIENIEFTNTMGLDRVVVIRSLGTKYQMDLKITPTNATNKKIIWKSSDNNIATISQNGMVTTNGVGITTITALAVDGNFKVSCKLRVMNGEVFFGDASEDGQITAQDLSTLNQAINGSLVLSEGEKIIYDLNGDGVIDSEDLNLLNRYILQEITYFPIEDMISQIIISEKPHKIDYVVGEKFNKTGMKVIAKYHDGNSKEVTNYNVDVDMETYGKKEVIVSYIEDGKKYETKMNINVRFPEIKTIKFKEHATKIEYVEGEEFEADGIVLTIEYVNGTKKDTENVSVDFIGTLKKDDDIIPIKYVEEGKTNTLYENIKVLSVCEKNGHLLSGYMGKKNLTHKRMCELCGYEEENRCNVTEIRNYKEAMCEEDGYTGDSYCVECGCLMSLGTTVPATSHCIVEKVEKQPTCNSIGVIAKNCSKCDYESIEIIPRLSHEGGKATCCEKAVCSICGIEYGELDKDNHKVEIDKSQAASCSKYGITEGSHCTKCGKIIKKQILISPTGIHKYSEWKIQKSATVLLTGKKVRKCNVCGKTEYKSIAKLVPVLKLSKIKVTLKKGKSVYVKVTKIAKGDAIVSWKTSNPRIAVVSSNGRIKSVKKGKTIVSVTLKSGKKAKISVNVT